ncbi:UDP-N-acetylglucosamine transferase subunit ALG14 homolog [Exaiptasia diaphana]|uniref:UDP-N-acetylglucosamine transferase subunit ALG14 n=1 Tax=Exaiptasia diaphana TaxID=2652724 RepID=A0A913XN10_EXADI|nr:UDP-N-acetylglucosamine transferase subunit ALG14 homolog [Exaiptasia diaphana]KXJ10737.1 UDP-N-acetylglucosamine transferase subunit ALG14-like [Exaiptasia diaphana]
MAAKSDVVLCEVLTGFTVVFVLISIIRVWWVLGKRKDIRKRENPVKTLIVAGSGGHTTEMLRLMSGLSVMYYPRIYVVADTDKMSKEKIETFENENKLQKADKELKDYSTTAYYKIFTVPRSREVRQSWLTTVITTLKATIASFPLIFTHKPEMVIVNGPGTCIPVCAVALIMKIIGVQDTTIVYVESMCRVETLSLSGLILYYFADHFFVQWQKLQERYPKAIYLGRLV